MKSSSSTSPAKTGTGTSPANNKSSISKEDELLSKMRQTKDKWDAETGPPVDSTDHLLNNAIEMAISQGKGWESDMERKEYLETLLDDDYIPPIFFFFLEELEKSGMQEAFSSLLLDDDECPHTLMLSCKAKGTEAFLNGKKNLAKNMQWYRDAVNSYHEGLAWADKVISVEESDTVEDVKEDKDKSKEKAEVDKPVPMTETELTEMKSTLSANAAMAHMQLKNWGHARNDSAQALTYNPKNIKASYRLAKCHEMLHNYIGAGDAIDAGLVTDPLNKDLLRLQTTLHKKVRKARMERQKRDKARAARVKKVKEMWRHCNKDKKETILLGRTSLVSKVLEEEDGEDMEFRWHHNHPYTGKIPTEYMNKWTWPVLFLYPTHNQSDFIAEFGEDQVLGNRIAQVFPDKEDRPANPIPWDPDCEFVHDNIAVYFEVHPNVTDKNTVIHPETVELLRDQGSAMRFYEASRALKGDEGVEMADLARAVEKKHLHKQRKAWIHKHGSLWCKPDACAVKAIHPGCTLKDILLDEHMVIANFVVSLLMFPIDHPAHALFLQERKCIGVIEPKHD